MRTLRNAPDLSKTGHSLRFLFISGLEGGNKSIDLKQLIILEQLIVWRSGLNEVPKSIKHVSSTIHELNLADNCITTLGNMENIVFQNLAYMYLMRNCIIHLNHMSLQLPALIYMTLSGNHLSHLSDMSTCQWGEANQGSENIVLNVEYNPWHCNGSMLWLQHSLCNGPRPKSAFYIRQPQGLVIDTSRLVCHSPVEFRGRALFTLNESALNQLDSCPKGEYHLIVGLSVDWFCVLYESPTESLTIYDIK